ncbi:MAG: hypothetical protein RL272_941 [Candidatus Parcubacteria bacterium]|jgi:CxxC-x17-CxxC domain-containing protein
MKPFKRDGRFSGGKKFGGGFEKRGRAGGGFGGKDFAKPSLFKTTCAECGAPTEVPFRPNGSKPVLCRSCFKKDGGAVSSRQDYSVKPRPFRGPAAGGEDTGRIEGRLTAIETKIDRIIREIEAMKEDGV